ncbi:MAG TPA: CDP-alcohol phosphatidyltransferase family protein [Xanthomonadales bacterium]|nr:CDP-alcohol phosphatidyltransferase family protein [Xanthomonadales bacterium]
MLSNKKPQIEKYLEPLAERLSSVSPNILTLLGSIPPLLFFVFVINRWYFLAIIAFLGTIFDTIDGMIARKYNKVTNFGGLLDSTMDRVSDFFIITAFSFGGIVRWEIVAPILLLSYLTSYIRAQGGVRSKGDANFASSIGIIERSERLGIIFIGFLSFIFFPNIIIQTLNLAECIFILLILLSLITVVQRMIYSSKNL